MNKKHGSPYDRGSADSYYGRPTCPHWYPNGTGNQPRIERANMTKEEINEYYLGYTENEISGDKKSWD